MEESSLLLGLNYGLMVAVVHILSTTFQNYLNIRQINQLRKKEDLGPKLRRLGIQYDKKVMEKTYKYNLEKKSTTIVSSYYGLFVFLVKIYFLFFGELYNVFYYRFDSTFIALIGFTIASSIIDTLVDLPFSYYSVFVIEEKFGFNKMTKKVFVLDVLKGLVVSIITSCIFFFLLDLIMTRMKDYFIPACWVMIIVFNIVYILIYPILIIPLTYKLENLDTTNEKEKEIMEKLTKLSSRLKFPLNKIYKIDGSSRSSHSQAFFFGVFKKRQVVLYDTLIAQLEVDEIIAVLCHEIGHWKYMHNYQVMGMVMCEVLGLLYLFSFSIDNDKMYFDFGFNDRVYFMGFTIFMLLLQPLLVLISAFVCALVRRNEYQADQFAFEMGHGEELKKGLVKISKENNVMLNPDPLYSLFKDTHPNILQRVEAIQDLEAKNK